MRTIKLDKCPFELDVEFFSYDSVKLKPGVTILTGCNGIGKSTFLKQVKQTLDTKNVPCYFWDDRKNGDSALKQKALMIENYELLSDLVMSSEGESIATSLGYVAAKLGNLINNKHKDEKEFWILLDSIDSGFSIDNVIDLKELLFKTILEHHPKNMKIYILVSGISYEMVSGENCLDISTGKFVKFNSYDDYKTSILESKKRKDKRYE